MGILITTHAALASPAPEFRMSLAPETRMIFLTAGPPAVDPKICELGSGPLDWRKLLTVANREGADPVVGRRFVNAGVAVPPAVAAAFAGLQRRGDLRAALMRQRLASALDLLSSAGVEVMLLKGAALAAVTYRSANERPMSDIDLLVHADDAAKGLAILSEAGWAKRHGSTPDELYTGMHHLPPLLDTTAPAMAVSLELHTELIPPAVNPFHFSAQDLWRSAEPLPNQRGAYVPAPEHRLLHTLVHFSWSHMFTSGGWRTFRDIEAMMREGAIHPEAFVDLAHDSSAASCCYWPLALARLMAGVEIPDVLLTELRPLSRGTLHDGLLTHLAMEASNSVDACPSQRARQWLWSKAVQPRRNGHGRKRPWMTGERPWHLLQRTTESEPGIGGRYARGLLLLQYLRSVAGYSRSD